MRLHAMMECSLVNGPGRRTVIWLQGCELHCPSCWNPSSHPRNSGTRTTSADVVSRILHARSRYHIEGVTLSGGEPIHQIDSVIELLVLLRREAPDLSAGLFSGYTERELEQGRFETYTKSAEKIGRSRGNTFAVLSISPCWAASTNTSLVRSP